MADMWYYAQGDQRKGPVEAGALKALVDAGVVQSETLVWREGMADWEPAFRHVQGLAPSVPRATGGQAMPQRAYAGGGGVDYHRQVGFSEAFRLFFSNYFNFSGRSNRGEYWWAFLGVIIVALVLGAIDGAAFPGTQAQPLSSLWSLATFIPGLSLAVRRLHDLDRTGWWVVAPLGFFIVAGILSASAIASGDVPGIGIVVAIGGGVMAILLLVWYCQRGTSGPNRFG